MNAATLSSDPPRRKQLADQLDRLDDILDALSEGLNGAVAEAVREDARLAVKDAIVEILTDPDLRAQLHQATASAPMPPVAASESKLSLWTSLKAKARQAVKDAGQFMASVADAVLGGAKAIVETANDAVRAVPGRGRVRTLVVVGLGVGLALGVTAHIVPHAVAVVLSGISGAVTATAVQISVWTRRTTEGYSDSPRTGPNISSRIPSLSTERQQLLERAADLTVVSIPAQRDQRRISGVLSVGHDVAAVTDVHTQERHDGQEALPLGAVSDCPAVPHSRSSPCPTHLTPQPARMPVSAPTAA